MALSQQVWICHSQGDCPGETCEILWGWVEGLGMAVSFCLGTLGARARTHARRQLGLSLEPGRSCMYLWELEDGLTWELLSSTRPGPFGSIKLSIATASEAAC